MYKLVLVKFVVYLSNDLLLELLQVCEYVDVCWCIHIPNMGVNVGVNMGVNVGVNVGVKTGVKICVCFF